MGESEGVAGRRMGRKNEQKTFNEFSLLVNEILRSVSVLLSLPQTRFFQSRAVESGV
jgi:hypothetical protein